MRACIEVCIRSSIKSQHIQQYLELAINPLAIRFSSANIHKCQTSILWKNHTIYSYIRTYKTIYYNVPYKLRINMIQLDLVHRKLHGYNLTLNHKKLYEIIKQP